MKVVIFGGSGFIGRKLAETLYYEGHQVVSISQHGKPKDEQAAFSTSVEWIQSDLGKDTHWQKSLKGADWIIDTIGILFEQPKKERTYQRLIIQPVQILTTYLNEHPSNTRLLFISANHAPFFLRNYLKAKKIAENIVLEHHPNNRVLYPSLVSDPVRPLSVISAQVLSLSQKIPGLHFFTKAYTPITRQQLANEVVTVLNGKNSFFTQRHDS